MDITTKWNIGDDVWAVDSGGHLEEECDCPCCNGKGGAMIPGTAIRVDCKSCNGTGKVTITEYQLRTYHARCGIVSNITATVNSQKKQLIKYGLTAPTHRTFTEAKECAEKYTADDAAEFEKEKQQQLDRLVEDASQR